MIHLRGKTTSIRLDGPLDHRVWRLVEPGTEQDPRDAAISGGPVAGVSRLTFLRSTDQMPSLGDCIVLPRELDHLSPGDVIAISPDGGRVSTLFRRAAPFNSILLTERCDNYCLMCSQPPRDRADDWLLEQAFEMIELLDPATDGLGFTGGEPTLYGSRFIELLRHCDRHIPRAGIHILSNGRRFADLDFTRHYAGATNDLMMVGIPIYGAEASLHDYVVQATGAFEETVRGILNLASLGQHIEIRVVVHQQTAPALVEVAEFISRNLTFVDQVALMGLEMMGLARANIHEVWIDPFEYREHLTEAVEILAGAGIHTKVYNHQLCLIDPRIWDYAVKSISDWKNEYAPPCQQCSVIDRCGGFFHSAKYRTSDHIHPIF